MNSVNFNQTKPLASSVCRKWLFTMNVLAENNENYFGRSKCSGEIITSNLCRIKRANCKHSIYNELIGKTNMVDSSKSLLIKQWKCR